MSAMDAALAAAFLLGVICTLLGGAIVTNVRDIRASLAEERAAEARRAADPVDPSWAAIIGADIEKYGESR